MRNIVQAGTYLSSHLTSAKRGGGGPRDGGVTVTKGGLRVTEDLPSLLFGSLGLLCFILSAPLSIVNSDGGCR